VLQYVTSSGGKILRYIWVGLVFEIIVLTLIRQLTIDYASIATLAILFHIIFTMIILMCDKDNNVKISFLVAYFARIAFMFWDIYARNIFILPNSGGGDAAGFFNSALQISGDISLLGENIYGGVYAKIMGFIFYLVGPSHIMGQYINVLYGLSVVIIIYRILKLINIDSKVIKLSILIVGFFPNSLIMSSIFLRESIITFLITLSLYYFIKWFKFARKPYILTSIILLGFASMFHSGVVGIFMGYSFAILFYNKSSNTYKFSTRTVITFIIIIIVGSILYTQYNGMFFQKFSNIDNIEDIYTKANNRAGGSAYLNSLKINNPIQLIIYGPIKSFFFLTSPLPLNWRGFIDVFTFITDSSFYFGTIYYFLKNRNKVGKRKNLVVSLIIMIASVSLIFGIGVSNAGTAVRHRQKLLPLFIVLLAVIMDGKQTYGNTKKTRKNSI
jgi:hypothetical protein